MKAAFHTLGCKVNQYETEAMKELFLQDGYEIADEEDYADVYVVNTCTVTSIADRKSRQYIRRMKKQNPDCIIAVTGCYAQTEPEALRGIPEVDIIAGNNEKHNLVSYVREFRESGRREHIKDSSELAEYEEIGTITAMDSRTRAYIKIEDGCNRFCSYCIIPYARGPVRSRGRDEILREAENLLDRGFRELVLTGINTALYEDLPGLLADMDALRGDFRIRLSSLEPAVVDSDFVQLLFPFKKLTHHLHLSIQSGSDSILRAMNRPYDREQYFKIVDVLREFDPLYGITTDMIAGFPGETAADQQDSLSAIRLAEFGKVHVFRYSQRKGTAAEKMPAQIDPSLKKQRSRELSAQAEITAAEFFRKNCGSVLEVLLESRKQEGEDGKPEIYGYAGNYVKVYTAYDSSLENSFAEIRAVRPYKDGVYGVIIR